jgi:hypothetical protein
MPDGFNGLAAEDQLGGTVSVLDAVRSGTARTKPEISRLTGLGRNVVTQRVNHLVATGLLEQRGFAPSNGGRNPRTLRFRGTPAMSWLRIWAPGISASGASTCRA